MRTDQIKERCVYEVSLGKKGTGVVKVVRWNPKTKTWTCKDESGKEVTIKDAKAFIKEVKSTDKAVPKKEPASKPDAKGKPAPEKKAAVKKPVQAKPEVVPKVSEAEAERLKKAAQEAGRKAAIAKQAFDSNLIPQKVFDEAQQEFEDAKDALIEAGIKVGRGGGRSIGMMGGKEAAFRVLQEEGKPMRARELCEMAHERGYCNMPGLTPWATIAAAIVTDINAKGDASKFKKVGPGLFTVNEKYKED